ncbi:MAG: ABC transporter permease [Candidatus Aminicenantes bacterium]|nr:MAG: ABC transporter permease [Candidatus Aminicenantes bacterium]
MKNLLLLARKDFIRKWRNPIVIIGFTLIPVVFAFIFGLIFGTSQERTLPRISVLAVDEDQSLFSEFFLSSFKQGELNKIIDLKKVDKEQGLKLMNKGKASALLIIPQKFGEKIWEGQPVEISLLKNPSEQFLPQIVEEICDISSLLFSSLFSVFSDELGTIKKFIDEGNFPDIEISSFSVQLKRRIESISKYVFPPIISLKQKTIKEKEKESPLSIQAYILPAIAVMFLLFICNVVFEDILKEKKMGTLLRMTVSPLKISDFIWSKILISTIIGILCTFILIALGRIIFSIHWGNPFLLFFIVICLNFMIAGFISSLYTFIQTEQQAGAVLSSVIMVMSLLGGSMVPAESFPPFILNISKLTLNYWGIQAFRKAATDAPFQEIFPILLGMILAGIFFSIVGSYFLNKNLKKGLLK